MVSSKYIGPIALLVTAAAVAAVIAAMVFSDGSSGIKMEYEEKLFDTSDIISLNIIMADDEWDDMIENAINEEYYTCDVEINGTRFNNVGIRPKGNTSLSSIVNDPDTNRYSFKLEFGHFVEGQTCWGLDKLILNNNYADATNMKEAITYDMFKYLGADASLYNYADISVNGEYWGIYLALEGVESSFLMRNYGAESGDLYKPDPMSIDNKSEQGGRENKGMPNGDKPGFGEMPPEGDQGFGEMPPEGNQGFGEMPPEGDQGFGEMPPEGDPVFGEMPPEGDQGFDEMPPEKPEAVTGDNEKTGNADKSASDKSKNGGDGKGGHGGPGSGSGADLNYSDDDLDSYSSIWEAAIFGTDKKAEKRVVTALKNIAEGSSLERYMDIDNLLKYMAVHSFVVNEDSLSGNMSHNYYLYESGGRLNIIPWDYNLVFGGMGRMGGGFGRREEQNGDAAEKSGSSAASMINDPIDTPFDGTKFFDTLLENEEYLAKYHEYYQKLVDEYVNGGEFDKTYKRILSQISDKVDSDPNAFYSFDEFTAAHEMLYKTIKLRAESVKGQLDGTIPSTKDGQSGSDALIDASEIDTSVMGSMHNDDKGMGEGGNGERRERFAKPPEQKEEQQAMNSGNMAAITICGAVTAAAVIFAALFKRRKRQ